MDAYVSVCPGCNHVKRLTSFGCCNPCKNRVTSVLDRLEETERMNHLEVPLSEYYQAEQRYQSKIEEFGQHLLEMKRSRKRSLAMPGGWTLYREVATRIVAGAQSDLKALREGLAQYQEMIGRAGG